MTDSKSSKNSTHVMIWGVLGIPVCIGVIWFMSLIRMDTTYIIGFFIVFACGYGFLIQGLLKHFEKEEKLT